MCIWNYEKMILLTCFLSPISSSCLSSVIVSSFCVFRRKLMSTSWTCVMIIKPRINTIRMEYVSTWKYHSLLANWDFTDSYCAWWFLHFFPSFPFLQCIFEIFTLANFFLAALDVGFLWLACCASANVWLIISWNISLLLKLELKFCINISWLNISPTSSWNMWLKIPKLAKKFPSEKSSGERPLISLVMLNPLGPDEESGDAKNARNITAGLAILLLAPIKES